MPKGFMDEVLVDPQDEPKKKKAPPSEVETLQNKLAALDEERRRRLNADVTSLRSGRKVGPSKEEMDDLASRTSELRKQLAKARADERRALAKP